MAVTAAIVFVGHNNLRYLITQDGQAGTTLAITSTGAATPDLLTDSVQGPIKKLAKVITDGYGSFAAGAQTQAKARALWLSDTTSANPNDGDPTGRPANPLALCRLTNISEFAAPWYVDANVSGGNPTINITAPAAADTAYLDVEVPNTIGA